MFSIEILPAIHPSMPLRSRLRDYYAAEGWNDPVVIDLRKGGLQNCENI
jgi:hypothetical protein